MKKSEERKARKEIEDLQKQILNTEALLDKNKDKKDTPVYRFLTNKLKTLRQKINKDKGALLGIEKVA